MRQRGSGNFTSKSTSSYDSCECYFYGGTDSTLIGTIEKLKKEDLALCSDRNMIDYNA